MLIGFYLYLMQEKKLKTGEENIMNSGLIVLWKTFPLMRFMRVVK